MTDSRIRFTITGRIGPNLRRMIVRAHIRRAVNGARRVLLNAVGLAGTLVFLAVLVAGVIVVAEGLLAASEWVLAALVVAYAHAVQ